MTNMNILGRSHRVSVHSRHPETSLVAVIEEEGVDGLSGDGPESERDFQDAEDDLDIRDLLLDETD